MTPKPTYEELEERFRAIVSNTPDHILVQDKDLRYVSVVNPQLGLTEKDMVGRTDFDILAKKDAEKLAAIKRRALKKGETVQVETTLRNKEGEEEWFEGSYIPRRDAAGKIDGLIGYFRNVTDRKRAEAALQEANADLERKVRERTAELTQRAAQLRALAGELTLSEQRERRRLAKFLHDHLQQLLVGAKFRTAILGRSGDELTRRATGEIEHLIDESIAASRSLTAELSPPILHEGGLGAGLEWLARRMKDQHGLIVDLSMEEDLPPLADDVNVLLFESVRELLFNAVKHARAGSANVSVRRVEGKGLRVSVSDDGAGFDPGALRKAGEAGLGMGLFSIRERLGLIGGAMETESAPGKGSRFMLEVPLDEAVADSSPPAVPAPPAGVLLQRRKDPLERSFTIRVLLADDHAVVREGLARLLGQEPGITVVGQAADGLEAVALAAKLTPDVVLMDMGMPKLSGLDATRAILRDHPGTRVIGLSMFEEADRARAMLGAGAVDYLPKSGEPRALVAAVRDAASRRTPARRRGKASAGRGRGGK